ncbi:MAG: hypothetical protein KDE19_02615, partial [Caldilineaceae bacterium]|nr:hypothetical protein [Caldilineaceae bacterium]
MGAGPVVDGQVGCQVPNHLWVPQYDRSVGDKCVEFLDAVGIHLDEWQQFCLRESLGIKQGGKWSAKEVALMTPRQNGKTLITEARELLGLFLLNEKLIIHCLATDTPVLTVAGWKQIVDVGPGDYVFHPSGKPIAVTGKSPVWLRQNCFRVTTTDGRELIADADHSWIVTDRRQSISRGPRGRAERGFKTLTLTTKEMYELGVERYPDRRVKGYRFTLPRQGVLQLPERDDLPIDPYLLGAWLGDGASYHGVITASAADAPWWEGEVARLGYRVGNNKHSNRVSVPGLVAQLKELGVYKNKHIPERYLRASPGQREALLQGLMDADGTTSNGRAGFVNTNRQIAEGVLFLARSLGWRAVMSVSDGSGSGFKATVPQYRVAWMPKLDDEFCPVRMPRKVANLVPAPNFREDGRFTVSVKSIEPVESVPVSCITVDAEDSLFLAGEGLIPTRNSAQLFATAHE